MNRSSPLSDRVWLIIWMEARTGFTPPPSQPIGYELGGSSVLFKGDYKIVINRFERNETDWRMYDIKTDPGEVHDLKDARPRLFEEMLADYEAWEEANNVLPMPEGYNRARAIFGGSLN